MFRTLRNVGFVVLLVYVWYVFCAKDEDHEEEQVVVEETKNPEVFRPTREWQTVKKGQPIPPGLHVRMNLETGVTEAKLLDGKSQDNKANALTVKEGQENTIPDSKLFKTADLKKAMKNIKGDDIINPDDLKLLTKKYRKYEDIKKELDELKLVPRTDAEILHVIMDEFKESQGIEERKILQLLDDLDFMVHQIDNALEFVKNDGFTSVIYPSLNSTDVKIKRASLKLFSSLVQNNPKVKVEAVETGSINILLKLLSLDPDDIVKMRTTTAISCLLRRFPYAQLKFVENGGLSVITELFESKNIKLKIKLATLISDLLLETKDTDENNQFQIKEQYKLVDLEQRLLEHNWCENLKNLLEAVIVTDLDEHDSVEKCLLSIRSVIKECKSFFDRDIFIKLEEKYKILAKLDEGKDEEISNTAYFNDLSQICTDIVKHIPEKPNLKTEL